MTMPPTARPNHPNAVGTITAVLAVYQAGDPGTSITLPDGTVVATPGYRLDNFREMLGGDQGILVDPIRGESHLISVAAYASLDPTTTYVLVGYQLTRPGMLPAQALPNFPRRPPQPPASQAS